MPVDVSYLAAFLTGLFGAVHCVGMCGGIVGALGFGLPEEVRGRPLRVLPYLLAYNAGRLTSYLIAGILIGGLGRAVADLATFQQTRLALQMVAGLFMVALGLYLGGWWFGLTRVERAGGVFWRHLEPLGRRLMPVRSPGRAYLLGLAWGWLPCGMVYTVLIWSLSAGSWSEGGLLMLSFGLGTLPNLLAMGLFAANLASALRRPWVRRAAGALVATFGLFTLARPFL